MKRLTSIVAVNHEKVIGSGNALPWRLRTDMQFFRETTLGNVVLMGRKTYDSLGKRPLKGRFNVVVSHSFGLIQPSPDCTSATGIDDALFRAKRAPRDYREHFVIGGASMYDQLAPYVDRYLVTLVDKTVPGGDTFFDDSFLHDPEQWDLRELFSKSKSDLDEASFTVFEIVSKNPASFAERRRQAIARAEAEATAGLRKRMRSSGRSKHSSFKQAAHPMF
jgi:dihydrofolate reductase